MYEVTVETTFSAAHALVGYKGKCESLHGHNYRVAATVRASELDPLGLAMDFSELRRLLAEVVEPFDHADLGRLEAFSGQNPSAENMARVIYRGLRARLPEGLGLARVTVWETEGSSASYYED